MNSISMRGLMVAAAIAVLPASALAKGDNIADRADALAAQANRVQQQAGALANDAANAAQDQDNATARDATQHQDHNGFPWGILGLIGLAGLLGLKRNDRHDGRSGGSAWDSTKDPAHRSNTGSL